MSKFIKNLQSLNPEELEQTRQLLDSDESFASEFKGELDQLDSADYQVAQSMILGQEVDNTNVPEGQQVAASRHEEQERFSGVESAGLGFAQSIPFADEIQAAVGVGVDLVTGDASLGNIKESYQGNLNFVEGVNKDAKAEDPKAFGAGRIAGEVATSVVAGAGVVKAAGAVTKGSILAANVGADVVLETGRQLAGKDKITFETLAESAGTAAMYSGVGLGIGTAVSKSLGAVSSFGSKVVKESYKKALVTRGNIKMTKKVSNFLSDQKLNHANPITTDEYAKYLDEIPAYKDLINKGDLEGAQIFLTKNQNSAKIAKESIVRDLESKFGGDFAVSAKEVEMLDYGIFDELQKSIEKHSGGDPATLRKLQQFKSRASKALSSGTLTDELGNVQHQFSPLSYSGLQTALDSLQDLGKIKIGDFDGSKILGKIRDMKNSLHGRIPNGADELDIKLISKLPELNKKIQVYKHAGNVKADILTEMSDMTERGILGRAIENGYNHYSKNSYKGGIVGAGIGAISGTAAMAKSLLLDPKTIGKLNGIETIPALKQTMSKLDEVASFFATGSGSKSPYAGSLMSRMFTSVKDNNMDKANEQFAALESTSKLLKSPLERTTASFMQNKQDIFNIVSVESPELLKQLETSLLNKEDLAPILDALTKTPAGAELIQAGVGWEGKVFSKEDKKALEKTISNDVFLTGDYKVQMIKALRDNGIVPDVESAPKRKPRRYELKSKKRPY